MCMCSAIMDTRRDLYAEGSVIEKTEAIGDMMKQERLPGKSWSIW